MLKEGTIVEFSRKKYFKYIKPLGSGGTGDTHLFLDETTDIKFAIKKYAPKGQNDISENYKRFVDEIKILFNLFHPNVVRIYNYYLYPEMQTGYLQMEFIEGKPINEFEFNWEKDWNDIFIDTISAFQYLEEHHILHRDIRPENILIDANENIKIIDFGFGKKLGALEQEGKSVFLNWPVSEWPEELVQEGVYYSKTEIYFVGKLFQKLFLDDGPTPFKFRYVLDKMTKVSTQQRYESFTEAIRDISQGILAGTDFSDYYKKIYRDFADALYSHISCYKGSVSFETNVMNVLDNLAQLIRVSALEEYLQDNSILIRCFIACKYMYKPIKDIKIEMIKKFYDFLNNLSEQKQQVVLGNIITRLATIPVKLDDIDIPF